MTDRPNTSDVARENAVWAVTKLAERDAEIERLREKAETLQLVVTDLEGGIAAARRERGEWERMCGEAHGEIVKKIEAHGHTIVERDRYAECLMTVCHHLELPRSSESGPCDDPAAYDRALETLDVLCRRTEAERAEHASKRYAAEAEAQRLRNRLAVFKEIADAR